MILRRLPVVILLIWTIMSVTSCEKLSDLLKADVVVSIPIDCIIPASSAGDVISIDEWMTVIDLEDKIFAVNNQLGADDIKSISIQSAYLSIPSDNRLDEDNLTKISNPIVYFQSDAVREWKNIASWTGPCESSFIQNLNVNTTHEWNEYFDGTSRYSLKMQCVANSDISQPIQIKGEVKFLLKVSA